MHLANNPSPDEAHLVKRLQGGDEAAFREIYDSYWERLYNLALTKTGNSALAEDLTQDLFTSLWLRRDKIDAGKPLEHYLFGAMKNQVLNVYRRTLTHQKFQLEMNASPDQQSANTTYNAVLFRELNRALYQQISELPEKCQQVFILSRQEDFSVQQIADTLGISPKTAHNHMSKALKTMRLVLKDYMYMVIIFLLRI